MHVIRTAVVLAAVIAAAPAQERSGPQVVTFLSDVDNTDQPYGLYVPRNYDPARKYPLVVSLHGADSNHRLNLRRVFGRGNTPGETDVEATRIFPRLRDVEYIVASPLARGTMGYQGIAEKDVYDVVADVKKRFKIDNDRVYLTGLSMGGGGTLWLGLTRPDFWAAIAPVCPAPPHGVDDLLGNALDLHVKLFQGALDPLVRAEDTRRLYRELTKLDVKTEYIEYPAVRHNAWDSAYRDGAIFDWFAKFQRNLYPERVRFATSHYKYNKSYWVRMDHLEPGELASVDARFTGKNKLTIEAKNLQGVSFTLKGHPMFAPAQPLTILINGERVTARGTPVVSLTRSGERWGLKRTAPGPGEKAAGAEGPISEVTAARHIYVYGTADSPSEDELARRKNRATAAATWSTSRRPLMLTFAVMADTEVKPNDMASANLVLFGTKESNSVIANLAPKLPIHLNAGAADYGLVYVWPTSAGHYALINSGLPWWTRADQAQRAGLPFIPDAYLVLNTFADFILFKGGLDGVVTEGYFDSKWRLPDAAQKSMLATGAVTLQ